MEAEFHANRQKIGNVCFVSLLSLGNNIYYSNFPTNTLNIPHVEKLSTGRHWKVR